MRASLFVAAALVAAPLLGVAADKIPAPVAAAKPEVVFDRPSGKLRATGVRFRDLDGVARERIAAFVARA